MKNIGIKLTAGSREINVSPIAEFFDRNQHISPESIAFELEHLRDCMVSNAPEACDFKDIKVTYSLLSELISLYREM
jgi:hypothetical protein